MANNNLPFSRHMMDTFLIYQNYVQTSLASLNLGLSEYPILLRLAYDNSNDFVCQNDMARDLHRDKALIARAVKRLIQLGYLTTTSHPHHKSKKVLQLTETGLAVAKQVRHITQRWDDAVQEAFSPEEWNGFSFGFEKVLEITEQFAKEDTVSSSS